MGKRSWVWTSRAMAVVLAGGTAGRKNRPAGADRKFWLRVVGRARKGPAGKGDGSMKFNGQQEGQAIGL